MTNLKLTSRALVATVYFITCSSYAQVTLNVTAQSRIVAAVQHHNEPTDCIIQGSLADELGSPLPNKDLELRAENLPGDPSAKLSLMACDENGGLEGPRQFVSSRTNEAGRFCVRVHDCMLAPDASVAIAFAGGDGYESATVRISLNSAQPAPALTVLEGPSRFALEAAPLTIAVQLSAPARTTADLPISLSLLNSAFREPKTQEKEIGHAITDSTGIARFRIERTALGEPGPCQLRAQFAGSKDLKPASVQWAILKTCTVELQAQLEQPAAQVGDSISLDVAASSNCGAVDEGSLEFTLNRKPQAAIPLRSGHARWHLSTYDLSPGEYSLLVTYVPSSAGYIAGSPQLVALQLTPVSIQRRAFWWLSGGAVLLWLVRRYLRHRSVMVSAEGRSAEKVIKPQSLEVEPSATPEFGWIGAVYDSHTGAPIAGATIMIVVPSFEGVHEECRVVTGRDGAFEFPHRALASQSKLSVSAPGYVTAQWPMPKPGKLMVRLETRRRATIRVFIHWADKAFPRAPSIPEPTPAHIRAVAEQPTLAELRDWASRVEQAAFGPEEDSVPSSEPIPTPPAVGQPAAKSRK